MTEKQSLKGKIVSARKEMGKPKLDSVGHAGRNGAREYKYASLAAILDVVEPPLLEVGCMVTQCMEDGLLVTKVIDADDELVMDRRKVKVTLNSQEDGSAETYAKRYALSSVFGLAAVEDDDGASVAVENPVTHATKQRLWSAVKRIAELSGGDANEIIAHVKQRADYRDTEEYMAAVAAEFEANIK